MSGTLNFSISYNVQSDKHFACYLDHKLWEIKSFGKLLGTSFDITNADFGQIFRTECKPFVGFLDIPSSQFRTICYLQNVQAKTVQTEQNVLS